ncbi:MAG: glycerol kinase GlpK [Dehalococcoidia bacterium]
MTYVLAIDQGTTSSRAIVVDGGGRIVGLGQVPFPQHFPHPGWVEHEPEEIWTSTLEAVRRALTPSGIAPREIAGLGITNQRETVVLWERATGAPLGRAIVWQDRRSAAICDELRERGLEPVIQARTGLTIDPYFSGSKLTWLLRQDPELRRRAERGEIAAGTVDSWLLWKLTGGGRFATDYTNASRTLLLDIHKQRWDGELCDALEVPMGMLPEPVPSTSDFGYTDDGVLGAQIPILAMAGDQQAALYGQACFRAGLAKNTYGTGCFLLVNRGAVASPSGHRLLTSLSAGARKDSPEYALEGSVFVAGALVQWLRDGLGIVERSEDIEELAGEVEDSGGVTIVPAFTGLGAPHWDAQARGAILGLTRGASRGHIARAALEAIAFSSLDLAEAMAEDLGRPLAELRVDGGASANNLLMQLQADLSGIPVVRPTQTETTALGVAYLAGSAAGVWAGEDEIAELWRSDRRFEPGISATERQARLADWRKAVGRVLERDPA